MEKDKKSGAKRGRKPFEVTPRVLKKVEKCASIGMTEEQIADALGICVATLSLKKKQLSEFSRAIKKGKARGIKTVTNATFENATKRKPRIVTCPHCKTKFTATIDKPDTVAQIFFLKSRAGWRDKEEPPKEALETTIKE